MNVTIQFPLLVALVISARAAEIPAAPVPKSPYLPVVYRYADAMLKYGRDTIGPLQTGLFLSALDRKTLKPLTNEPACPTGVRVGGRAWIGANPQHDQNLLRLLYTLRGLSGNTNYEQAADNELRWFLENARAPATDLLPWGEHLSWNVLTDQPPAEGLHEFFRPWMLWGRCFELAPDASRKFALGLWNHQIADQTTGAFDRHAGYAEHDVGSRHGLSRHAGFFIRTWAEAYAHTRDSVFTNAIAVVLGHVEKRRDTVTGLIPADSDNPLAWPASNLSLSIDCDGAAHLVDEPLATRLRSFAAREDQVFCQISHPLKQGRGFLCAVEAATGKATNSPTSLWSAAWQTYTTAQVGMMLLSRYDNTGRPDCRDLMLAAADAYLDAVPDADTDVWPGTMGQAISLQLAAWRHTARPVYLQQARTLADWALKTFWSDNLLPRASSKTDHYETITGADTLALALVELHLQILAITAVRCPPNTIDR